MKNHLFVTLMLTTANLSSFATVEPTEADSVMVDRGVKLERYVSQEDKLSIKPSFSAVSPSGHKLFYQITNAKKKRVSVIDSCGSSNAKLKGDLIIPATVNNGGTTYSVTAVGATAFMLVEGNGGLTSVDISEGVESIGDEAFCQNKTITRVSLPNSLSSLGYYSFGECGLTELVVPGEKLRKITERAFGAGNSLVNVVIKEGVTEIEENAICCSQRATNVRIELPSTISKIHLFAISGSLNGYNKLIIYREKPLKISEVVDYYYESVVEYGIRVENFYVYVPSGCAEAYRNHEDWSHAKAILEIPTDIEESEVVDESNFYSANGILYSKEPVIYSVYDMVGRCLYAGNKKELSLPKGLYIVKTVDKAEKVMVR